jgi:hypothetical protein
MFEKTVREYNAACQPGAFDPVKLDGLATTGHPSAQVELGEADRLAAIQGVPDHLVDRAHVRGTQDRSGRHGF